MVRPAAGESYSSIVSSTNLYPSTDSSGPDLKQPEANDFIYTYIDLCHFYNLDIFSTVMIDLINWKPYANV